MLPKLNGVITIDELAELFKLPSIESVLEANVDYALLGFSPDASEEENEKREREANEELFGKWHHAVLQVAEKLFGVHKLELNPRRKGEKQPYEFKVVSTDWKDAANEVITTINGVGYFCFDSLPEFIGSGPYGTARQAVLNHLHWIKDHPEVYGDVRPMQLYQNAWKP